MSKQIGQPKKKKKTTTSREQIKTRRAANEKRGKKSNSDSELELKGGSSKHRWSEAEIEKSKKIKRINERRAEIERAVEAGELPREYLDTYEAAMRSAVHDDSLFTDKGNISHGQKTVKNIDDEALDALLEKETAGQARKNTYKYYKKYREEQEREAQKAAERADEYNPFDDNDYTSTETYSYNDYINDRNYVYDNIDSDPDWYVAMKAMFQGVTGRKSYNQVRKAHEAFTNATPEEQQRLYQEAVDREQAAYFR